MLTKTKILLHQTRLSLEGLIAVFLHRKPAVSQTNQLIPEAVYIKKQVVCRHRTMKQNAGRV